MTRVRGFVSGPTLADDAKPIAPFATSQRAPITQQRPTRSLGAAAAPMNASGQVAMLAGAGNGVAIRAQAIGDPPNELSGAPEDVPIVYDDPVSNIFALATPDSESEQPSHRERVLKEAETELGPLVESSAAPRLAAVLLDMFTHLADAQDKRAESSDVLAVNELFFADTPRENAYIVPQIDRGVRRVSSLTFASTGIMRTALGIDSGDLDSDDPAVAARGLEAFNRGMAAIAGLYAHELGHPLDDVDPSGYAKTSHRKGASHAIELKTDIQAIILLRDAGYPVEGLRHALAIFEGRDTAQVDEAATTTHPPTDLRVITLELAETLARYEFGPAVTSRPFAFDLESARAMAAELRGIELHRKRWEFVEPKDFAETLARLGDLAGKMTEGREDIAKDKPEGWARIEQNRLLVRFGEQLAAREARGDLPRGEELDQVLTVLTTLRWGVADNVGLSQLMTSFTGSEAFAKAQSFRARAEKSQWVRSREVRDWLADRRAAMAAARGVEPSRVALGQVAKVCRLVPADVAADLLSGHEDALFSRLLGRARSVNGEHDVFSELPTTVRMLLSARYIERHLPADAGGLLAIGQRERLGASGLLPLESSRAHPRATHLRNIIRTPAFASVAAEYRAAMEKIWENRGPIACGNGLSDERIDWHLVAELAGATVANVDASVRAAVQEHIGRHQFEEIPPSHGWALPPTWFDSATARRYLRWTGGPETPPRDTPPTLVGKLATVMKPMLEAQGPIYGERLLLRLRQQFERTGRHNLFVERTIDTIKDGIASGRHDWLARVTEYRDPTSGTTASPPLLSLALDVAGRHAPADQRIDIALALCGNRGGSVVATSPTLLRKLRNFCEASTADKSALALLERLGDGASSGNDEVKRNWPSFAMSYVATCGDEITGELEALGAAPESERKAKLEWLTAILAADTKVDAKTAEGLYPVKEALAALARGVVGIDAAATHADLAKSGPTPATDAFCVDLVIPSLDQAALETLLKGKLLYSEQLRLDLTLELLESRWPAPGTPRSQRNLALSQTIDVFNDYAPEASKQRDVFLETLGWRYGLMGRELNAFVEDQKSANWRRADPLLVRLGSAAATTIAGFDRHTRHIFIQSLIARKPGEPYRLPREVRRAVQAPLQSSLASLTSAGSPAGVAAVLEQHISDAAGNELIPLLAMTMRAGVNALTRENGFPRNVMHHIGCQPDEERTLIMEAFLETLPAHELSPTIAYFMAQEGGTSDWTSGFEVFDAPGIMVGQLAHTFGLVAGVAELQQNAKRLSKSTIHRELAELPRHARDQLDDVIADYVEVVGSAKLKTVVKSMLNDGRRAALMVRRPNVAAKVKHNFAQGRLFVERLEAKGVKLPLRLVRALIDAAETQMNREVDFREEAKSLGAMRATLDEINASSDFQPLLHGWRFKVPQLIEGVEPEENMLLTEFAEGVPFKAAEGKAQLDVATRKELGPVLVKTSLALLFRYGCFEADRHLGNWRFDLATKTINFIDIGQLTEMSRTNGWQSDDRLVLAQFIQHWSAKDARGLTDAFFKMGSGNVSRDEVEKAIRAVLDADDGSNPSNSIARITEAVLEAGITLEHRFLFGGLKGLMVLLAEGYVDHGVFADIMEAEVRGLMRRKAPALVAEKMRSMLAGHSLRITLR